MNPTLTFKLPNEIQSKRNMERILSCGLCRRKLKNIERDTRNDNSIAREAIQPDNFPSF